MGSTLESLISRAFNEAALVSGIAMSLNYDIAGSLHLQNVMESWFLSPAIFESYLWLCFAWSLNQYRHD